jgi:hypothetical protein
LAELEAAVARDLQFRQQANSRLQLSLGWELFAFGRPLFHLLLPLGVQAKGGPASIQILLVSR